MVQFIPVERFKENKSKTFQAQPKLSEFDYWIQFIGLVCSFAGLSLHGLITIAIEFLASKVRKRKVLIGFFYLRLAILFLSPAFFGYLTTQRVLEHKAEENNPKEKETRNFIKPKLLHLAICVPIRPYVGHMYRRVMSEIEKKTDEALIDALEGIYVNNQGRSFQSNYQVQPKVLVFRQDRCFLLSIRPNYEKISLNPKLTIKFKNKYTAYDSYLLSEDENFNEQSFKLSSQFAFQKRIVKRLRTGGRCVDYKKKYAGNCTDKWNCRDRCIQRKFVKRLNRITFGTLRYARVIDRDWFSLAQWNTSELIEIGLFDNKKQKIYEDMRMNCSTAIPDEKPCDETKFERTFQIKESKERAEEIDLEFQVIRSVEERPSWYKLILDLASIQSIFFGLTVLGSLQMVCSLIQRESQIVWFLIYLFCSFGFSWQTYHIFHLIISGELIPTEHYGLIKQIKMPEMIFCREIGEKIDRNQKLTGTYLEQLTSELTAGRMFENITYLTESNEWIPFDLSKVKSFFLGDLKCFKIRTDRVYQRDQFHFSTERQVLKVNFNRTIYGLEIFVYFMTRNIETEEFSRIFHFEKMQNKYSIIRETSLYEYEDRFSFIKKYFSSSQEDVSDLHGQLLELQKNVHNLRTPNLPVEEKDFKFELDEVLFWQLYLSQKKNRNK